MGSTVLSQTMTSLMKPYSKQPANEVKQRKCLELGVRLDDSYLLCNGSPVLSDSTLISSDANVTLLTSNTTKMVYLTFYFPDRTQTIEFLISTCMTVKNICSQLQDLACVNEQFSLWLEDSFLRPQENVFALGLMGPDPVFLTCYPVSSLFPIQVVYQKEKFEVFVRPEDAVIHLKELISLQTNLPLDQFLIQQNNEPIFEAQSISMGKIIRRSSPVEVIHSSSVQLIEFQPLNCFAKESPARIELEALETSQTLFWIAEEVLQVPFDRVGLFSSQKKLSPSKTMFANGLFQSSKQPTTIYAVDLGKELQIQYRCHSYAKSSIEALPTISLEQLGQLIFQKHPEEYSSVDDMEFVFGKSPLDRNLILWEANFLQFPDTPLSVLSRSRSVTITAKLASRNEEIQFEANLFDRMIDIQRKIESLTGLEVKDQIINTSRVLPTWRLYQNFWSHSNYKKIHLRVDDGRVCDQFSQKIKFPRRFFFRTAEGIVPGDLVSFCDRPNCPGTTSIRKLPTSLDEFINGKHDTCEVCLRTGMIHYRLLSQQGTLGYPLHSLPNCISLNGRLKMKFDSCGHFCDPKDFEQFFYQDRSKVFVENDHPLESVWLGKYLLQCPTCLDKQQHPVGVSTFISVYLCSELMKENAKSQVASLVDLDLKTPPRKLLPVPTDSASILKVLRQENVSMTTKRQLVECAKQRKEKRTPSITQHFHQILTSIKQREKDTLSPELIACIEGYLFI